MLNIPSVILNAVSLLSRPADGSQANAQARAQAETVIMNQIESLKQFIGRRPESKCAQSMQSEINRLEAIIGGQNAGH